MRKIAIGITLLLTFVGGAVAQEVLLPLYGNPVVERLAKRHRTRAKSVQQPLTLPFFDDFSNYSGYPDSNRWADNHAFVNADYAVFPPTVGVATLDAIDACGELHRGIGLSPVPGDTLTSLPIRLDSLFSPYARALTAADSIYFSFYFQPGGGYGNMWERVGVAPEAGDSLILEFFNSVSVSWDKVWSTDGFSLDSLHASEGGFFRYVAIPIIQDVYLKSGFKFRFRNYVSINNVTKPGLSGNCDMWNIDYVYLDYSRTHAPTFRDIAFVNKATSMLKQYTAMPTRQFRNSFLKDTLYNTITNLYSQQLVSRYEYKIYDGSNRVIGGYTGGSENVPAYLPNHRYQTAAVHARPPLNDTLPAMTNPRNVFRIVHVVTEGYTGDNHPQNDTIVFEQVFDNYFAYDDGVPENGYGITTNNSRCSLGYRFSLSATDTLTAIDMYFNRTYNNGNSGIPFYICVWSDNGGTPGSVLYKAASYAFPRFDSLNQYCRYPLERPLVVSGTIYIGFEQHSTNYINLGFDRSNNTADNIYYFTSGSWQQSYLSGSLMMRPYFGQQAVVGLQSAEKESVAVKLRPNPCKNVLFLDYNDDTRLLSAETAIYNMYGKCCKRQQIEKQMDVSDLPAGVYVMRIVSANGQVLANEKFIVTK
ncbi:MAG: T9SS type A sorting domain-containing protein [Bacteroidales bacterium]|nr:T9SS type A sorting domain-containing protein [Bacteroidales bacterium]